MLLIDTNVIAYFFNGNSMAGRIILDNEIAISSITYTEILSNKKLNKDQRQLVTEFLNTTFICHTNDEISKIAVSYCLSYNIKPLDALIAATATFLHIGLATADKKMFKLKEIQITKLVI